MESFFIQSNFFQSSVWVLKLKLNFLPDKKVHVTLRRAQIRTLGARSTEEREQLRLHQPLAQSCTGSADSARVIQMWSLLSSPVDFLATRHQHPPLP